MSTLKPASTIRRAFVTLTDGHYLTTLEGHSSTTGEYAPIELKPVKIGSSPRYDYLVLVSSHYLSEAGILLTTIKMQEDRSASGRVVEASVEFYFDDKDGNRHLLGSVKSDDVLPRARSFMNFVFNPSNSEQP